MYTRAIQKNGWKKIVEASNSRSSTQKKIEKKDVKTKNARIYMDGERECHTNGAYIILHTRTQTQNLGTSAPEVAGKEQCWYYTFIKCIWNTEILYMKHVYLYL